MMSIKMVSMSNPYTAIHHESSSSFQECTFQQQQDQQEQQQQQRIRKPQWLWFRRNSHHRPSPFMLFLILICHHINNNIQQKHLTHGFYITTMEQRSRNIIIKNRSPHSIFGVGNINYNRSTYQRRGSSTMTTLKATRDRSEKKDSRTSKRSRKSSTTQHSEKESKYHQVQPAQSNNKSSHKASSSTTTTSINPSTTKSSSSSSTKSSTISSITTNKNFTIPEITLFRKEKQKRRKLKHPRRPSSFWADLSNIESELRKFWSSLNVPISSTDPPPIPNEALLNHFERHDLRYAIANMGGRDVVSERLDGAKLIPGKWTQAVTTCKEVQYLLHPSNPAGRGLSEDVPPLAPYVMRTLKKQRLEMKKKQMKAKQERMKKEQDSVHNVLDMDTATTASSGTAANVDENDETIGHDLNRNRDDESDYNTQNSIESKINDDSSSSTTTNGDDINLDDIDIEDVLVDHIDNLRFMGGQRWAHSSRRNPRGHWNLDVIVQELYQYLSHVKEEKGRPSVWMPRPSELATEGRNDLKQAMVRFGGSAKICTLAKLVPYRDWRYFESTLELYVELLKYLIQYHDGSEKVFPKLADIQEKGHRRLYDLIMEYGGRKIIATRLGMEFQAQTKLDLFKGMSFGPFSLDFAVRLMYFIRNDMMEKDPPLEEAMIKMPTKQFLLDRGEDQLAEEISIYGGHESIARRLNLAFDEEEAALERKVLPQCDEFPYCSKDEKYKQ